MKNVSLRDRRAHLRCLRALWTAASLAVLAGSLAPAHAAEKPPYGADCNKDCADEAPGGNSMATRTQACRQFVMPPGTR